MSRKAAVVEEFDDDTDLPLPSRPLPNTGSRGPLLQELDDFDDDVYDDHSDTRPGPASASTPFPAGLSPFGAQRPEPKNTVTDLTPYKSWTCIYPIYIDAKRPYGTGQRRIERAKSVWWPLSADIADAAVRLGLRVLHEVQKSHPRDWENPGRVRVQWKNDGNLVNPVVKTKKQLLEMICFQIQHQKPENIPKPPFNYPTPMGHTDTAPAKSSTTSSKGKQPAAKAKSTTPAASASAPPTKHAGGRRLPAPPEPQPPLANRVSAYSPVISTGMLIDTVKAGMNATEGPGAAPGAPGVPAAGMQKGKRKVVRVRG